MDAHGIVPHLFLGSSDYTAADLTALGVDTIVNMTPADEIPEIVHACQFHRFPMSFTIDDVVSLRNLRAAILRVYALLKEGRCVYLHCWQGVNRSATVAIGVVMLQRGIPLDEARAFVHKRRPITPSARYLAYLEWCGKARV